MKFLIFSNYLPSVLHLRGKLLQSITSLGYEIHILVPNPDQYCTEYNMLTESGFNIHSVILNRTGTNPIDDLRTLYSAYKVMNEVKPDVVLSYTIKPVIYGTLAAWLSGVPKRFALLSGLGYSFQNSEKKTLVKKIIYNLYREGLAKTTKVFFQNPDDLTLLKEMKIIGAKTPYVIVNGSGVDTKQYNVSHFPKDDYGNIKPSFLLIARLLKDKGINEYISAAKIVRSKYPKAEFHLVGWIDENPEAITQNQLDEWVSSGVVNYWGKLNDVRPAITASSVYVLPSYREGTPRSVLEAMSMGRAIITTDAPGCRETVNEGENGFLVPVKDSQKLAEAMLKFIEHPILYQTMGDASRKIAESKYDVHKVNAHMISEMQL